MTDLNNTKEELIIRLNELQKEYNSLKAAFEKDTLDRKEAEDALKRSQVLLRSSIESSKDMIILSIDKHYQYLFFNSYHHAVMLNAYGKEVTLDMNLLECITNDDDRAKAKKNYDRALNGESHITIEEYGDINRYYYETRYNPVLNDKNEVIGATVFSTNVTERKHNELLLLEKTKKIASQNEEYVQINEELSRTNEELHQTKESAEESEKKYKLLYESNPMPMSIFDAQTLEFLSVNEAFCDKYGFTKEEFLNMTILEIRPETEIEKLKQSVSLTDKGITNAGIFLHKKKNGEIIQVEIIRHELIFDNRNAKLVLINDVTEKLKAESVLRETQFKLNEAYKLAHIGIWEWEIDTDIVIWTEELYRIAGLDPLLPAPTYMEQAKLYAPESWKILNSLVERTLKTSEPYQTELELIRPGGDIRYVKAFGGVLRDANGQIKGLFGTLQDITERKQAEEVLREREYLLSSSQRAAHVGTWSWKVGDATTFWSDETYRIYGLSPEMGPPDFEFFFEIIHPDDRYKMREWPAAVIAGLHPSPVEFRVLRPDGIYRIIRTEGDVIETIDGVPSRIAGTAYDITESKQAESALVAKHELFRKTFNISPLSSVLTKLPERTIIEVNPAFEKLFGYTRDEVIGKSINDLILWADLKEQERVGQELLKSGNVHDLEFVFKTKTGKTGRGIFYGEIVDQVDEKYVLVKVLDITERKLAEEKIKENSSLVRIAAEKAKLGGWNVDLKENRSYWSDEVAAIHEMPPGYAPLVEEGINFYAPEWHERITQVFTNCALNGIPYDEEMEIFTSTGRRVWVRTIGEAVRDENGKIIKVQGAFQDISEKKLAEEKIREKDIQFRKLSANVSDLIFQFTRKPDGTYFVPIASEGIRNIFGCSPEDVLDDFTPIGRVIYPEDAARVISDIEYSAEHLTYFTCEFRVQIPGKEIQWILSRSTPEKLPDGSITWYGFNADITERKLHEEHLFESEIRFRKLYENSPFGMMMVNQEFRFINVNQRFCEIMDYSEAELLQLTFKDISHLDDLVNDTPNIRKLINKEMAVYKTEKRYIRKDGNVIWGALTVTANYDKKGQFLYNLAIVEDITPRKLAEENIRQLNDELEQRVLDRTAQLEVANKELDAFSYSVSHDLRAPLRHINGYIELLNDRFKDNLPEKARHYLFTVSAAAKQMGTLIDDLLQFSRTGRQEMSKVKVDMNVLVKEVLEKMEPDLKNRKIIWTVKKMPEVYGDYSLLKLVWVNLLDNAVKYTRLKESTRIEIECIEEKGNFVFSIRDNGVGFDMKYAQKLFGVFQRMHAQTEFEGTGIGLANVQRIILKHNGRVWADAKVNKGATFYFSLPKIKMTRS